MNPIRRSPSTLLRRSAASTLLLLGALLAYAATQTDIAGPAGSGQFGNEVVVLSNGNFVVADPGYDLTSPTAVANVGAIHLYDGATRALISTITGSGTNFRSDY